MKRTGFDDSIRASALQTDLPTTTRKMKEVADVGDEDNRGRRRQKNRKMA